MAGISSRAAGKIENKKNKFQDQEFNDDLGVNYYEFKYRNHDPQIGRFIQIDPLAEEYVYNSTYAFSENKVTGHIELEGLEAVDIRGLIEKGIRQTSPNASEKDIARVMKSSDEGQVKGGLMAASWLKIAGIGGLMFAQPEIGIPLALSELSGVPVTPSPQAMAGTVLASELSIAETNASKGINLTSKTKQTWNANNTGFTDDALVVRGGLNSPDDIIRGTGSHPSGVTGVSVNCGNCSVAELSQGIKNGKIGVTNVGEVRKAGGDVIKTSGANPNHATMTGLSPQQASSLLNPVIKKPPYTPK